MEKAMRQEIEKIILDGSTSQSSREKIEKIARTGFAMAFVPQLIDVEFVMDFYRRHENEIKQMANEEEMRKRLELRPDKSLVFDDEDIYLLVSLAFERTAKKMLGGRR